jgi:hypothetical protein
LVFSISVSFSKNSKEIFIFRPNNFTVMNTPNTLVIFALVAALGFVAIEGVDLILTMADAAGCENGQAASTAVNASKGRCFGHGP